MIIQTDSFSNASYSVQIEKSAWDELMAVPEKMQGRLFNALESLEKQPRPSGVVKLSGIENLYRIRVGNYRILYRASLKTSYSITNL